MKADSLQLQKQTPESQGVSSRAILTLLDAWETQRLELHSFVLMRHGRILAEGWWEPYTRQNLHELNSLTKSFTATAVGFALAEGRLALDDPIMAFFPDEAPTRPGKHLRAMQIRHLLSMTTGHARDPQEAAGSLTRRFLSFPVEYAPGTHFVYNNAASNILAALVQNVTGQRLEDYLTSRLFTPLGIHEWKWEIGYDGINSGSRGLKLRTEDIARFGQLYVQQGAWKGMQLLQPDWVQEATSCQFDFANGLDENSAEKRLAETSWRQGYGFQFWRGRQGLILGSGAYGQFCIIAPQSQTVIAITAGVQNADPIVNLFYDHLLATMTANPLPEDADTQAALCARLSALQLKSLPGIVISPCAAAISGRDYLLVSNPLGYRRIRFDFQADSFCRIHLMDARGEHLLVGRLDGKWQRLQTRLKGDAPEAIAVQCAWTEAETFMFRFCQIETPYCTTAICRFDGQLLRLRFQSNVGNIADCAEILGWYVQSQSPKAKKSV